MRLKKMIGALCLVLSILSMFVETVAAGAPAGKYEVLETEKTFLVAGKLEVIVFVDFYCHHCLEFDREVLQAILLEYGERLEVKLIGLPVIREESNAAIELYLAAAHFGKGEVMKELLFNVIHDPAEPEKSPRELIGAAGLPFDPVFTLLRSGEINRELQAGIRLAERYGIHATPGVVINGKYRVVDLSLKNLTSIVDGLLRELSTRNI